MRGMRRQEHPRRDDGSRVVAFELRMKPVGEGAQEDLAYLFALDKRYVSIRQKRDQVPCSGKGHGGTFYPLTRA